MMCSNIHDQLSGWIEDTYIRSFINDRLISATEDFLEEEHIDHDYDPRNLERQNHFNFKLKNDTFNCYFINTINETKVRIYSLVLQQTVYFYEIIHDPNSVSSTSCQWLNEDADKNKYVNLAATKEFVPDDDYEFFEKYTKVIDEVVEKKKEVQKLFRERTNPGMPEPSTYMIDDFIHKFEMELSWMKSKEYVSNRISFDEFLKMDIDDLNYNNTIYRLADRSNVVIEKLNEHLKNKLMLSHLYRMENVRLNGLFYVENCDLQDVSEAGYDTIDILCSSVNDTEPYKVVEIYLNTEVKKMNVYIFTTSDSGIGDISIVKADSFDDAIKIFATKRPYDMLTHYVYKYDEFFRHTDTPNEKKDRDEAFSSIWDLSSKAYMEFEKHGYKYRDYHVHIDDYETLYIRIIEIVEEYQLLCNFRDNTANNRTCWGMIELSSNVKSEIDDLEANGGFEESYKRRKISNIFFKENVTVDTLMRKRRHIKEEMLKYPKDTRRFKELKEESEKIKH